MKKFLNTFYKQILSVFLLMIMLGNSVDVNAQRGDRRGKLEKLKIAFITEKLNLSPETAKEFWPVYNEYDNAKQILFRKYKRKAAGQNLSMQDIEHRMEREKEFLDLRKKYITRLGKILTPVQIADLKRSERQFKKLVLRRANQNSNRRR